LGAGIAQWLGGGPTQRIKEDLRRLKQMMETGEIATIDGQTSGRAENEEAAVDSISAEAGAGEVKEEKMASSAQIA